MSKFILKLYVTGKTNNSDHAIANIRRVCRNQILEYDLRVIDVLEKPEVAEREKIMATPTLVKEFPLPIKRIIGDLSNKEKILFELGIISDQENVND